MKDAMTIARERILNPAGLSETELSRVLANLLAYKIDVGELYFQLGQQESWVLEDGIVKEGTHSIEQGVGVRAVSGEKTGFAYADEITLPALLSAAESARAISRAGQQGQVSAWKSSPDSGLYLPIDPISGLSADDKVALLMRADVEARKQDARVKQVIASVSASHDVICVACTDGTLAADIRPLVRVNVTVIVEEGKRREQASSGGVGVIAWRYLAMRMPLSITPARLYARRW